MISRESKTIPDLKKVLISGDVLLLRPGKENEYLIAEVTYDDKIAVNAE